jgi:hypothetical protein
MDEKNLKFCYNKTLTVAKATKGNNLYKAVAYKEKYWDKGQTLKIYFMGGTATQRDNMQRIINNMIVPLSLKVSYVGDPEISDIRISFKYGYGSYSYLGTDALFIPKNQETLNIGWSGDDVMYHEFGHALNLLHEHSNPKKGIVWDEEKVIEDLSGAPNYWTVAQIRHNVLDKVRIEDVDATNFDPNSIMLYYFPNSWTKGDFQTNKNYRPSSKDMQFLIEKYAFTEEDTIAPVITLIGDEYLTVTSETGYEELGAKAMDNKDGDITSKIKIEGKVDTSIHGLQYIKYTVQDEAGNIATKTRTIMVNNEMINEQEFLMFLKDLYPEKRYLAKLTEPQLMQLTNKLDIKASISDLKKDTVNKVWDRLNLI